VASAGWKLRAGTKEDYPAIARIESSFSNEWLLHLRRYGDPVQQTIELRWRKARPAGSTRDFRVDEAALADELNVCDRLLVAVVGQRVIGYLALKKNWNNTAELGAIIVDRKHREQGIGKRFVIEAERFARGRRLRALQWEAQTDNRQAIEFAVGQGFRIAGHHDALYRNRGDRQQLDAGFQGIAVFMVKELS
jgi:ribosomal protein S18 acetylase RimI-like enzyme